MITDHALAYTFTIDDALYQATSIARQINIARVDEHRSQLKLDLASLGVAFAEATR